MNILRRTLAFDPATRIAELRTTLGMFGLRGWALAFVGGLVSLGLIGLVASLFDNPVFTRQLDARPQDYIIWVISAVLGGLILGTFAVADTTENQGKAATGGFLSVIAVGCPICNKVAVTLLGTSGALNIFGPSQLFIGIASLLLLAWTLVLRAQAVVGACPVEESPGLALPRSSS